MIPQPGVDTGCGRTDFDPRARIIGLAAFIVAVCAVADARVLAALAGLALALTAPAGARPGATLRRLVPVNMFMLLLWLTMPLLAAGPRLAVAGPVTVSLAGVEQALAITLKANALVLATSALLVPVEVGSLAVALTRLGVPVKLAWLCILTHRSLFGLAERVRQSLLAIRLRSGRGRARRFAAYGGLLAKLFVIGHQSGDRLHAAMLARGYGERLTLRRDLAWRRRDTLLAAGLAAVAAAAIGWSAGA